VADMIESNKDEMKRTVASTYNPEVDYSPKKVAKSSGKFSESLILTAIENEVPIYLDKDLMKKIARLDLLEEIPTELYGAVADILTFIYALDAKEAKENLLEGF
jgi:flagellar biosynthesis protein